MAKYDLLTYLLTHCFAFPKNSFNFTTQKSEITEKLQVQPFNYKVTSKLYSKLLPITKFRFTLFQRLCLAFPKNGFNFVIQKFAIKWKILFPNAQNIRSWPQDIFKTNFLKTFYDFSFKKFSMLFLTYLENGFDFSTQKFAQKWRMSF